VAGQAGRVALNSTPLIYNANNFSHLQIAQEHRYIRRNQIRSISGMERLKKCGKVPFGPVTLGLRGSRAEQHGFTTCGSIWICPVCSSRILAHRSQEVRQAVMNWEKQGGKFIFETFTLFHRSGETVAKQRLGIQAGWQKTNSGAGAKFNASMGQVGYLRVLEVTYGENGFHLHMHVLRFLNSVPESNVLSTWKSANYERFSRGVMAAGFKKPSRKGHDFTVVTDAERVVGYFTKGFDNPQLNEDSTSIWNLASRAIADPESRYAALWRQWERESKGMRQMTWSKGIRDTVGLGEELDDEDIAFYEAVFEIEKSSVNAYSNLGGLLVRLRSHLEKGDLTSIEAILGEHEIAFRADL
jgi:hypothetical protein